MKTFKNYEEIEEIIENEDMGNFETFAFNDLDKSITKQSNKLLDEANYEYIIIMHPHQSTSSIHFATSNNNINKNDFDFDLKEMNSYLNNLDIRDVLINVYDLNDLNSFEIYCKKDLKNDFKTVEEATDDIYEKQGYHNKISKEQIMNKISCFWN